MLHALRHADRLWFVVCLGGELVAYAGYIAAYRDVARVDGGPRFRLWTVARVVAVGFGAFVAGSSFGTLGVDYWALHKAGEEPHRAVRRVLALNTLQWGVLAAAAAVAAALLLAGVESGAPLSMELAWLSSCRCASQPRHGSARRSRVRRFTDAAGRRDGTKLDAIAARRGCRGCGHGGRHRARRRDRRRRARASSPAASAAVSARTARLPDLLGRRRADALRGAARVRRARRARWRSSSRTRPRTS